MIDINDVDAHWVKKKLSDYFKDKMPEELLELESKVMELLSIEKARECDSKLAALFSYEHSDLNTLLVKNRFLIYYKIKLERA